jgi:oligoribonuclease NrnB/cAMP/cGMP phosphodiesterase (DHH superfamily)
MNRILFHNDLDGICCAAFYLNIETNGDYVLYPVKTQIRGEKFERLVDSLPVSDTIIILDFQYNKRAKVWIDHHYSSNVPKEIDSFLVNDITAKSAFSILAPRHGSLLSVNMVDACLYPNVDYIFESVDPVMTLNRFITSTFPHDMIWCRVVEVLAKTGINFKKTVSILGLDAQEYLDREQEGCENIKNFMCVHDSRISIVESSRVNEYPRYSEFYVHKFIDYAIRKVSTGNGKCQVEIMFNKFSKAENLMNIGKFMSANQLLLTGGGHNAIGGGSLMEKNFENFISQFVTELNGEDMEKLAVDVKNDSVEKRSQELIKQGAQKDIVKAREEVIKDDCKL